MDMIAAYNDVGSYRGAAAICGVDHKTVKRAVLAKTLQGGPARATREHNFDVVADVVAKRVAATSARISAKRLLPEARAAGYPGSARNFRRLVAKAKRAWRADNHRGRRPGVWAPGEVLVIDWGVEAGLHIFCAVMAFSRWRFVRFASDERAATTMEMLARCFEALGGYVGDPPPDSRHEPAWGQQEKGPHELVANRCQGPGGRPTERYHARPCRRGRLPAIC
jgi:transposase